MTSLLELVPGTRFPHGGEVPHRQWWGGVYAGQPISTPRAASHASVAYIEEISSRAKAAPPTDGAVVITELPYQL